MKKLDWYIVRKFLGTFFFSIVLVLSIAIVFDLTEKMDDFFENQIPLSEIILDYYLPFIPYYMNMFSSLFIFISVISLRASWRATRRSLRCRRPA